MKNTGGILADMVIAEQGILYRRKIGRKMTEKKTTYKIGQILTSNCDVEVEKGLFGDKVVIPKGNKIIIGADKRAHHMKNGMIQPLAENIEVKGYDVKGIAEFIFSWMSRFYPVEEMLENYDINHKEFISEIECALDEIGF